MQCKGVANFGRVITRWKAYYGEPGRIISQPVVWEGIKEMQGRGDIRIRLCAEETRLVVGQQYKVRRYVLTLSTQTAVSSEMQVVMEVHNQGNTSIQLTFDVHQDVDDKRNYLISGPTRVNLGQLAAGASLHHEFEILPVSIGSCQVDNVYVKVAGESPQEIQGYSSFWTKQRLQLQVVGSV